LRFQRSIGYCENESYEQKVERLTVARFANEQGGSMVFHEVGANFRLFNCFGRNPCECTDGISGAV